MARARAIVKRRKSVRNTHKITRTMLMVATVKFQRALRRAASLKHYALTLRQLITDLADCAQEMEHPLFTTSGRELSGRTALLVISSDRGLAGAYNVNVVRAAIHAIEVMRHAGQTVEVHASGRKAIASLSFKGISISQRYAGLADQPAFEQVARIAQGFMDRFTAGELDSVRVTYTNFITPTTQRPEVMTLLPLVPAAQIAQQLSQQVAEQHGPAVARGLAEEMPPHPQPARPTIYDFSPEPQIILKDLLPRAARTLLFQCFLDSTTSEHIARMVAMRSATDAAEKMVKALTMQYNRARQGQITTELSEIIGAAEAIRR